MQRLEETREMLTQFDGKQGLIPLMYFWTSGEKYGPVMVNWSEVPKQFHGQLLRQLHEGIGKPDSIFVIMEVRSLPMGLSSEETKNQNQELQDWKNKHGSFEGFPGIQDYAMFIGYDGENFITEMYELEISEREFRTFGNKIVLEKTMGGIFAENLIQAFHNIDAAENIVH